MFVTFFFPRSLPYSLLLKILLLIGFDGSVIGLYDGGVIYIL